MISKTIPSYQEGLHQLRSQLTEMLPADALQVFDTDAGELQKSFQDILKVEEGALAPDFSLSNALGEVVRLKDQLKNSPVILVFYRGAWCPYCNLQLQQYQSMMSDPALEHAKLLAVSPQTPDNSLSVKEKNELTFEVLSDVGNIVARKYTTVFKNGAAPLAKMQELGIDFDSFYGDDSKELPIPAVFVIDKEGIVRFAASEGGDYRNRVEPDVIREVISNL
ncbi:redoxin domain-containing protein [Flavobacteriaceae bacterium M23B6Z8]